MACNPIYVVMYRDGSWGSTGNYILGIFDNEQQANELVKHVEKLKDFERLSGSGVYVEEHELNQACDDGFIDYLA